MHFVKQPNSKFSGWKSTHLASVFSLRTSVFTSPHGAMLTAFADVKYRCLQMLDGLVPTHPSKLKTRPKQLLGFLPLAFELPALANFALGSVMKKKSFKPLTTGGSGSPRLHQVQGPGQTAT
jgi:hypothetical protein